MGISIDLEKCNYEKLINEFMKDKKINNRELLEKIMAQFGEHIGDYYIILHNEYYEDGICTWNLTSMIDEVFETEDSYNSYLNVREYMINYKEKYDAYTNLGIEYEEEY